MTTVDTTAKFQMKLPRAVRQTAERVAEMERKAQEPAVESESTETPAAPTATPVAPSTTPEVKPVGVQKEHDEAYWERRAKVLQGMLDAQARESKEKLDALNTELKAIKSQLVEADKAQRVYDIRKYIPEKELEELDEKQLSAAFKAAVTAANEDADNRIKQIVEPLQEQLRTTKESAEKSQKLAFYRSLRKEVPDLDAINEDPNFLAWLDEKAPFQKVNRLTLLRHAEAELDLDTVVEMFDAYKATLPAPKPAVKPTVTPDPVHTPPPSSTDTSAPVITRAEIRKFYDNVRRGIVKPGSKAYHNMEQRIALATKAGTVVN